MGKRDSSASEKCDFLNDLESSKALLAPGSVESWIAGEEVAEKALEKFTWQEWQRMLDAHDSTIPDNASGRSTAVESIPPKLTNRGTFHPDLSVSSPPVRGSVRSSGGVDWLELSIYGRWNSGRFRTTMSLLKEAKATAGKSQEQSTLLAIPESDIKLAVRPGARGNGYGYAAYSFVHDGILYGVCERQESGGEPVAGRWGQPIVYISATGVPCLLLGWDGVVTRARMVLRALGFEWQHEAVSRIDVCVDAVSHSVGGYQRKFCEDKLYRISRQWAMWGQGCFDGVETLRLGSTEGMLCRVYDKLEETSRDAFKRACMRKYRWDCDGDEPDPGQATRVEFQLRRKDLKLQGIGGVGDLQKGLGSVCEYLTTKWLRFTEAERDAKHPERVPTCWEWLEVQRRIRDVAEVEPTFERKRLPRLPANRDDLKTIAVGFLGRILAGLDIVPSTREATLAAVTRIFDSEWRNVAFKAAAARLDLENTIPGMGHRIQQAWCRDVEPLDELLLPLRKLAGL